MLSSSRLTNEHQISSFSCGGTVEHTILNSFLKESAAMFQKESLGITHVALIDDKIVGYITVVADSLNVAKESTKKRLLLKTSITKRLRTYPALKIGRLAVDESFQQGKTGVHVGKYLLNMAIALSMLTNENIAIRFLTVDAKDMARDWYLRNGFKALDDNNPHMLFFDLKS